MFVKRSQEILDKFKEKDVIRVFAGANFYNQEASGEWQVKGNGVLVLTSEELFFEMWNPKRIIRIPIQSIIKVETTKWHLSETKSRLLLKVNFTNEKEDANTDAWQVKELEEWINAINKLIQRETKL